MITSGQRQILAYLARHAAEGAQNIEWIADGCGHRYDRPWASSRLATLKRNGLVENLWRGVWRITDAGKATPV
jgi:hypothetical protein